MENKLKYLVGIFYLASLRVKQPVRELFEVALAQAEGPGSQEQSGPEMNLPKQRMLHNAADQMTMPTHDQKLLDADEAAGPAGDKISPTEPSAETADRHVLDSSLAGHERSNPPT